MTPAEREQFVEEVIERILLRLPEVVGNLMADHALNLKLNKEFYQAHPELREHTDVVVSVVEQVEGENPLKGYKEILALALPRIQATVKTKRTLSLAKPTKLPDLQTNGEL